MNSEFHYWMTGLIANKAGFSEKESKIIAYSSEYVDENDVMFMIKNKKTKGFYSNYISQTMNILKPKNELMRIYPIFHFIPGEADADTARRKDGKMHLLNTTPNSSNANKILSDAFKSPQDTRLYRIGIATHAYVDTWAHQNFVGWYDYFNNIGLDIKPDIGHADAEHHPDYVCHNWVDNRLVNSDINNRTRFLSAAKALYHHYCNYLETQSIPNNASEWSKLEKLLIDLMGHSYTGSKNKYVDEREFKYKQHISWLNDFDERVWFDTAIKTNVNGLVDSQDGLLSKLTIFKDKYFWKDEANKEETDWFKFQEAVKDHEKDALKILSSTFSKMGIDLGSS